MAIRVPSSRVTLNPNPWATWCKENPPFPGVDAPVLVAVPVVVPEDGRTTVCEIVLTLVTVVGGSTAVETGPGVVTTTGGVTTGGVTTGGVTTGGVTTGGVLGVGPGLTLMVTGLRPDPLHIP